MERIAPARSRHPLWSGLVAEQPAEQAGWIWLDGWTPGTLAAARFELEVEICQPSQFVVQVSADQRFQWWVNGALVALGPDRCDPSHWSLQTYRVRLNQGQHAFQVLVWWLPEPLSPSAQMTVRPGFVFGAEGPWAQRLATGVAPWAAWDLTPSLAARLPTLHAYYAAGSDWSFDLSSWNHPKPCSLIVIRPPSEPSCCGLRTPGWRLHPSRLPEQRLRPALESGTLVAARPGWQESVWDPTWQLPESQARNWQQFFEGLGTVKIPPFTRVELLWDAKTYLCAYPAMEVTGGKGSRLRLDWAEAMLDPQKPSAFPHQHASRAEVAGKRFVGVGDEWVLDGKHSLLPALWWRAGRFLRLRIETANEPLTLQKWAPRLTGYPLRPTWEFSCDWPAFEEVLRLCSATLACCAHEQWVDCPYYEQLGYVGDLLAGLFACCLQKDDALFRRSLELFDWSRADGGWVAMRWPSRERQDSLTYALLYPLRLRELAWWRGGTDFFQERLPGVRSLLAEVISWTDKEGLLGQVPGWCFVDWVDGWEMGVPPGVAEGKSSLLNLHFLLALEAWADLEEAFGERPLARLARTRARRLEAAFWERSWSTPRGLLADDFDQKHFSWHTQSLASLACTLPARKKKRLLRAAWQESVSLMPMSLYFRHYGLEASYLHRESKVFLSLLKPWLDLGKQGFLTTPEVAATPRSDCHGWSASPLFHAFASLAGIRPAAPGFTQARIRPMPGGLQNLRARLPHPSGFIHLEIAGRRAWVKLPKGVRGLWEHGQDRVPFEGEREFVMMENERD